MLKISLKILSQECRFEPVIGKEVHSENIEAVPTKEKSKFPQETFPEVGAFCSLFHVLLILYQDCSDN